MKKILIIDDDKNFIDTLKDSLKEKILDAFEIYTFNNVKDAFIFISSNTVDLIILDIHLEGMHGFEFLDIIKKNPRFSSIPVIMMSAKYIEPLDRIKAINMGASSYFTKPVDLEKLCVEIKEMIKR
ncbi:MAG: response regulator [Elusimicrobiales bacterium]|nr:response regulator [Elusimicrobiales bacterium]